MPTKNVYTEEELIQKLAAFAKQKGFTPSTYDITKDEAMPSPSVYKKRFGNWTTALRAAGLQVHYMRRRHAKSWTDSDIERWLKGFYDKKGRSPSTKDLEMDDTAPHPETVRKHFGGLNAALKKLKLPHNVPINIKGLDLETYLKTRLASRRLSHEQKFLVGLLRKIGKALDL